MEIERKYLLRERPADLAGFPCSRLSQSYISRDPVIRVRCKEQAGQVTYRLTVKGKGLAEREEFELPLTKEQYEQLLQKREGESVEKCRYRIPLPDGHTAELDIFTGRHAGLQLVEVEFSSREDMDGFVPPAWFGADVTGDPKYYNNNLIG